MHKPEVELTKLDPSDKESKIADATFDPLKTELPVQSITGAALNRECFKLHNNDMICHGYNNNENSGP